MAGTSGSETKFCQPAASQSKSTQTRPSSLGSRKTCERLEPCCFRFSRLVVENTLHQRSKSSTFEVARNNLSSSPFLGAAARRRWCGESKPWPPHPVSGDRSVRRCRSAADAHSALALRQDGVLRVPCRPRAGPVDGKALEQRAGEQEPAAES